ncbi:dihydrofolate reductase family protein [Streptomyces sp. NPDC051567]|uniref:dihydrofolate reductase family protein n=1 Tax=Streptomyces sp. NPDC051567 TaxID=3365660 RepID=UPI0037ACB37F
MRKIISTTNISLDGAMDKLEEWHFGYWSDDLGKHAEKLLFGSDAILMGRATYEGFAEAWPEQAGTGEFADRMNSIQKYVVSSTLEKADWENTTIIRQEDAVEEIAKLRQQEGKDILTYGFGPVARTLLANNLLDEVRFWVHPVIAGGGNLGNDDFKTAFKLTSAEPLDTGVVVLTYVPAPLRTA